MGKSGDTTMGMIECVTLETRRQGVRLNQAYKALMADVPPTRKAQLQEAQLAWVKYRDANCGFYANPDRSTLACVNADGCMMTVTADRTFELESFRQ